MSFPTRALRVPNLTAKTLRPTIAKNLEAAYVLVTDEATVYSGIGNAFRRHRSVIHSLNEYARLLYAHINTAESSFQHRERGITGAYHTS